MRVLQCSEYALRAFVHATCELRSARIPYSLRSRRRQLPVRLQQASILRCLLSICSHSSTRTLPRSSCSVVVTLEFFPNSQAPTLARRYSVASFVSTRSLLLRSSQLSLNFTNRCNLRYHNFVDQPPERFVAHRSLSYLACSGDNRCSIAIRRSRRELHSSFLTRTPAALVR